MTSRSTFRPRTDGHPSKYWSSAKLLDLSDRLAPDTYHTLNTVSWSSPLFLYKIWKKEFIAFFFIHKRIKNHSSVSCRSKTWCLELRWSFPSGLWDLSCPSWLQGHRRWRCCREFQRRTDQRSSAAKKNKIRLIATNGRGLNFRTAKL